MLNFFVPGIPQTKGSTRAFMVKGKRYPIITNDNPKNKSWAKSVSYAARMSMCESGLDVVRGPIMLRLVFYVPRPKRVQENGQYSTTRPDIDKMERSVLDALTGVCYLDDAQVCSLLSVKLYRDSVGVDITMEGGEEVMATKKPVKKVAKKAVKKPFKASVSKKSKPVVEEAVVVDHY